MKTHPPRRMPYERKKSLAGYAFISLWFVGFVTMFARPFVTSLIYAFSKITIGDHGLSFAPVGFQNFQTALFSDANFMKMLGSSLLNIVTQVPMIVIFSIFMATMLNRKMPGQTFYRTVFFLPVIIASGVIIGIIKNDPLSQQALGGAGGNSLFQAQSFQQFLAQSGLPDQLVDTLTTAINNVFELVWKSGIQIILCIAGLQTVSSSLYEAAQIEGASGWEIFWKITFPMMSPILMVCVVYTLIDTFTDYSNTLMKFINDTAQRLNFEYSAAMAWIYFLIIGVIVGVLYAVINRKVFYIAE